MKNDKENSQEVNIETNNDAVLYSVMLSFLRRKVKELGIDADEEILLLTIDVQNETIDIYKQEQQHNEAPMLIEEVKI